MDFGRPNDVLPATRMAAEELAVDVQSTNLSNKFEIEAEGMMTYSDSPSERGGGGGRAGGGRARGVRLVGAPHGLVGPAVVHRARGVRQYL